jgi:hypothetical protein
MSRSRKSIVLLLLALMLAVAVPAATAAGGPTTTVVHSTASFTIAAGQCPNLAPGQSVSGIGDRVVTTTTNVHGNGSSRTTIDDVVQGTATDNNGTQYTFLYTNSFSINAPASGPARAKMVDLFLLQSTEGHGANRNVLRAGFIWLWTFTGSDPFAGWPAADLHEALTFGDPVVTETIEHVCDPL